VVSDAPFSQRTYEITSLLSCLLLKEWALTRMAWNLSRLTLPPVLATFKPGALICLHYEIYAQCDECGGEHPMLIRIYLDDGPVAKKSIAEAFQGTSLPPQVSALRGHKALCLKTGKMFIQENDEHVFLVPTSATSVPPKLS